MSQLGENEVQLLKKLDQVNKQVENFKSEFKKWCDERSKVIIALMELVGGVAGATGLGIGGVEFGVAIKHAKEAKKLFENHKDATEKIKELIDELMTSSKEVERLATEDVLKVIEETFVRNQGHSGRFTVSVAKNFGVPTSYTIPNVVKSLINLRKDWTVAIAASTLTFRSFELAAADAAGGTIKVVVTSTGKAFAGIEFALSAIGIIDVASIAYASYNLVKGSETSVSKQVNNVAHQLEEEMRVTEDMRMKLDKCKAN